jgi:phytoene dehydrogenase-like protein
MPKQVEVAIIGAGLAGLACAIELQKNKIGFQIFESTDGVGGRVRSDVVDGFILDRGFQLYNPSYSEGKRLLNYESLNLKAFTPGVAIRDGKRLRIVVDPFRDKDFRLKLLKDFPGNPLSQFALLSYFLRYLVTSDAQIATTSDISAMESLSRNGIKGTLLDKLFRPFLQGVFLESELKTSRKFLDVVLKTFLRGTPSVPANGMQEISNQLSAKISPENIFLNSKILKIDGKKITTSDEEIGAKRIVVATDPSTAINWLNLEPKKMHAVTTWYFKATQDVSELVKSKPILFVDAAKNGPLTNAVVLSNAAPTYAPEGNVLVSASAIYPNDNSDTESVKKHLSHLFGIETRNWELIKQYKIKEALPAMYSPFSLINSNQINETTFVAGDHRAVSSIQGALISGTNAATSVKVSLGL